MKYTFLWIWIGSLAIPLFSMKTTKPKLCIDCKHYIGNNQKYPECSMFPSKNAQINALVNGIYKDEYYSCSVARSFDDMCGKEGKMYKENNKENNKDKLKNRLDI